MTQSAFIAAMMLAGFALFLAARGRLPTYAAVLWGPPPAPSGGGAGGGNSGGGGSSDAVDTALTVAKIAAAFA